MGLVCDYNNANRKEALKIGEFALFLLKNKFNINVDEKEVIWKTQVSKLA